MPQVMCGACRPRIRPYPWEVDCSAEQTLHRAPCIARCHTGCDRGSAAIWAHSVVFALRLCSSSRFACCNASNSCFILSRSVERVVDAETASCNVDTSGFRLWTSDSSSAFSESFLAPSFSAVTSCFCVLYGHMHVVNARAQV